MIWIAAFSVVALTAALVLTRGQPVKAQAPARLPLVSVARAQVRDLPLKLDVQGHLIALTQVDLRPQAIGTIRAVHFHEGEEVKAGQLMFSIDASDVMAQLAKSQASAAQIKATLDDAQRDLVRTRQLAASRYFSASAVDTSMSKVESLQAQHRAALADVESTRVLLNRTRILAPVSGLTGALSVHAGSLAQPAAAAPLVNIAVIDPIGVEFNLPESNLTALLAARSAGAVQISLAGPDGQVSTGKLVFINNTVNTDSGTINLKAAFPNPRKVLWPGAYVKIQLIAGAGRGAVTLPPQGVLEGPKGRYVFVLDAQSKAVATPVTLLRVQDQDAVVEGLAGGESVIVEGQLGLKTGETVRVVAPVAASGEKGSSR